MSMQKRPTQKRPERRPGITLDAQVAAILNRPNKLALEMPAPDCPACAKRAATTFHCPVCGYVGRPVVYECTCRRERDEAIRFYGEELAKAERREARPAWMESEADDESDRPGTPLPAASYRAALILKLTQEDGLCDPDHASCAHGAIDCPVCGNAHEDEKTEHPNGSNPWAMIRDLRRLLAARGGR